MESSGSSAGTSPEPRLLGILSDTHDNVAAAAAGITTLREAGAQFLIHCGDVGGEPILDLLAGIPSIFVWGNNDFDRPSLKSYALELGIQCGDDFARLEFAGKRLAVTHGDNLKLLRQAADGDLHYDYIFIGHSHIPADQRLGRSRIVNPGALHRAAKKTVAMVDLETDIVRFLVVRI
jgi:putative phosphoesterase